MEGTTAQPASVAAAHAHATTTHAPVSALVRTVPIADMAPGSRPENALRDVIDDTPVERSGLVPAAIDTEAEARLTSEIVELWGNHKEGKTTARRTRTEMKALRLELGAKLHSMKAALTRTGRGGGWPAYLRSHRLPLATADRYVIEHEASLAPKGEKLLTEEVSTATVDNVRKLAQRILPKVQGILTTQELVYEFVHELVWGIEVAEASYTDNGFELPKVGADDTADGTVQSVESAITPPAVP